MLVFLPTVIHSFTDSLDAILNSSSSLYFLVRYNDYTGDESNDGGSSYDGLDITGSGPSLPKNRLYSNIEEEEENKLSGNLAISTPDGVS